MISKTKAVFGLLKRIKNLDSNSFEDRLYAQKIFYILQKGFGIDFDYKYKWYLYGPYSTEVAHDFYEIKNTSNLPETSFKSEELEKKFNEAMKFFEDIKPDRNKIELLSSIIFANKESRLNKAETISSIIKRKPWYSKDEIENAWNILTEKKLIYP
jgi:uncharacterized protein YwgA